MQKMKVIGRRQEFKIGEISKLFLKPNDIVVVRVEASISREMMERIREQLAPRLPEGQQIIVTGNDITFSVLSPE